MCTCMCKPIHCLFYKYYVLSPESIVWCTSSWWLASLILLRDSRFTDFVQNISVLQPYTFTPFPRTPRVGDAATVAKLIMNRPRLFLRMVTGSERYLSVNAPLAFEPSVVVFRPSILVVGVWEATAGSADRIRGGRASCKQRRSTSGTHRDWLLGNTTCVLKRAWGPLFTVT